MTTPENTPDDKMPETGKLTEPAQQQGEKKHETDKGEESAG